MGPSLLPCGTPACTGIQGDTMFLILTAWRRSHRKLQIHRIMKPLNPEMDEFIDPDSVVNMIKSLTKIQKTGP